MSLRRVRLPRLWALLALFALSAMLLAALAAAQLRPAPRGAKAGRYYKNVQVLKDLPANQLVPTMRTFAASLGVKCTVCHDLNRNGTGFEKDTKDEKRTARQMILMTRRLNQREKVLDNEATCYMCHHGRERPQTKAPGQSGKPSGQRQGRERGEREREHGDRD